MRQPSRSRVASLAMVIASSFLASLSVAQLQSMLLLSKDFHQQQQEKDVSLAALSQLVWNGAFSFDNQTQQKAGTTINVTDFLEPQLDVASSGILEQTSKYAYAFVIGGCDPQRPSYRGYIYNILVSARLMIREFDTQADILALFQFARTSNETKLPANEAKWLESLGVQVKYLSKTPAAKKEDFYELQMRKFDILALTEYRRVIFLDGDVMPLSPLDYIFELSDGPNATLKENLIVSGTEEPANGGFFMLAPGEGKLHQLQSIIQERENTYKDNRATFDTVNGWGHEITPPDKWVHKRGSGRNWTFHAGYADQGLLYHWVKYHAKDVSIVLGEKLVENWGHDESGNPVKEKEITDAFTNHSKPLLHDRASCSKWMCDFVHFTGRGKPWNQEPVLNLDRLSSPMSLWWSTLREINSEISMGLNFSNWVAPGRPLLGLYLTRVG